MLHVDEGHHQGSLPSPWAWHLVRSLSSALDGHMSLSSLPWEVLVRVYPLPPSEKRKAALEWGLEPGHCHEGGWVCEDYRRNGNEKCK